MDKQKFINLLKTNKYLQKFVTYVYRYESDKTKSGANNLGGFNRSSGNSTAFGAGQFTTDTRNDVLAKYGIDAWSPNSQDQEAAMLALLDMRGVLDEVSTGNYEALNRSDLWETFTPGMPGYTPLLSDTTTSELEISEALEGERINSKYAPDESLEQMFPRMYQEKMALFEKDGVFPLSLVSENPEYEAVVERASQVQRGIKDKLAAEKPPVETKKPTEKPIEKSSVVDTSMLNKSQKDIYKELEGRINQTDYDDEYKEKLKLVAISEVSKAKNLRDLTNLKNIDVLYYADEVNKRERNNLISKTERFIADGNISYDDRKKAEQLLNKYKRKPGAVGGSASPFGAVVSNYIPTDREEIGKDLEAFLSRFDSTVPEPVKTETPAEPTTPTQSTQPQTREEVSPISLDVKGVKSIPNEMDMTPKRQSMLDVPASEPIKFAGLKLAGQKIGEGLRNLGINGESVSNALRAGAGLLSLYEAQKKDKVNKARVSPLMLEAVRKAEEISETGMPYEEKMAAIKDLNQAYSGAMKNVMAISGGQRGMALANMGAVDASRVNALVDLAGKSAAMRMDGMKMYQQAVGDYTQAKLTADMGNEKLQKSLDQARKDRISRQGISLYEQAMEFNRNFKDQENNQALIDAIGDYNKTSESNQYAMSALSGILQNIGQDSTDTEDTTGNIDS